MTIFVTFGQSVTRCDTRNLFRQRSSMCAETDKLFKNSTLCAFTQNWHEDCFTTVTGDFRRSNTILTFMEIEK